MSEDMASNLFRALTRMERTCLAVTVEACHLRCLEAGKQYSVGVHRENQAKQLIGCRRVNSAFELHRAQDIGKSAFLTHLPSWSATILSKTSLVFPPSKTVATLFRSEAPPQFRHYLNDIFGSSNDVLVT